MMQITVVPYCVSFCHFKWMWQKWCMSNRWIPRWVCFSTILSGGLVNTPSQICLLRKNRVF